MKELTINKNDGGQRLDKYLRKAFPALPPSLMHKYVRLKRVKLNGRRCYVSDRLREGDVLALYINDEFLEKPDDAQAYERITPEIDIVYEDAHILLVNKRAGMVVHDDDSGTHDTLINHIKAHLRATGAWVPESESSFAPALCHRIDRNTSGLVIAAKTAAALRILNQKIRAREVEKRYLCLVHGVPSPAEGTLRDYLTRDEDEKRVFITARRGEGAKTAELRYRVLASRGAVSLLECELLTGRTHQIRAQMAHFGHPLLGDLKYGVAAQNADVPFRHQALCAYRLTFAFSGAENELSYLSGRTFEASDVPFLTFFTSLDKK